MNYSEQATYGRKIVKGTHNGKSEYYKRLYISWGVCFLIGLVIGALTVGAIGFFVNAASKNESTEPIEPTNVTITHEPEPTIEFTPIEVFEPTEPQIISLGEYKLTAYCSCEKCCGYWATVRPKDEDGNPIVYTANKSIAKQGVTVAADTSVLPFGTVLLIDDREYIVQDVGGGVKGNHIDVYFESHEEALQFGVQYKEIFLKEGNL